MENESVKVVTISVLSIISIEALKAFSEPTTIILQLLGGVLTIVYLIKKIRKK